MYQYETSLEGSVSPVQPVSPRQYDQTHRSYRGRGFTNEEPVYDVPQVEERWNSATLGPRANTRADVERDNYDFGKGNHY